MNRMNYSDVGETLIREMTIELKTICFKNYKKQLEIIQPPQNEHLLKQIHEETRDASLDLFKQNCTGGISAYDNMYYYSELQKMIENTFEQYVRNNSLVSHMTCTKLVQQLNEVLRADRFTSIDQFDEAVATLTKQYFNSAKGPSDVKQTIFDTFLRNEVSLKRELVLKESAQFDFKVMVISLALMFSSFLILSIVITPFNRDLSTVFMAFYGVCGLLILFITAVFHNLFEIQEFLHFAEFAADGVFAMNGVFARGIGVKMGTLFFLEIGSSLEFMAGSASVLLLEI